MLVVRPCLHCRRTVPPSELRDGRCSTCWPPFNARRNARHAARRRMRQRETGRTTAHWERVKAEAKALAGYRCNRCPRVETIGDWLTCHLDPRLGGNHRLATIEDVEVLCTCCHSKIKPRI